MAKIRRVPMVTTAFSIYAAAQVQLRFSVIVILARQGQTGRPLKLKALVLFFFFFLQQCTAKFVGGGEGGKKKTPPHTKGVPCKYPHPVCYGLISLH